MTAPVILLLTQEAAPIAASVAAALSDARIHGLQGRVALSDHSFENTSDHLRALFAAGTPIIGICAAGILIRALAPLLADKTTEPPVLAVAEDGSAVVPLLGGHHGANDLATVLAAALGCEPAITTAGDLRFGVALDRPPVGWYLANPVDAKHFAAALLAGATVRLEGSAPWLAASRLPFADQARLTLLVTDQERAGDRETLVYHPARLAVGVGCERGTAPAELCRLVEQTLASAGLAPAAVAMVVSLDLKADEPAVAAVAAALAVPARYFDAVRLEQETPRLTEPSEVVFREVGCHGVAEAAALAAVGAAGDLVVPKRKSARATCAIARAPRPLDPGATGQSRGRLAIIGVGPGQASWRTGEADVWLARATDLVGYHLYLDLLGPAAAGKRRHGLDLGAEEARARQALDLAAKGREVALVSSGDAGIYAMATLVFELIDREARPDWCRTEVLVAPGISAMQGLAARVGAPLGHDFCAISLSDLLTPWPAIERRIKAAAEADFVVSFYNPVSQRRITQLAAAREILLRHRPPTTPVVIGRNLGRPGETVRVTTLEALDPAAIDMLTIVLVGASTTRSVARGDGSLVVYTPRGYPVGQSGTGSSS